MIMIMLRFVQFCLCKTKGTPEVNLQFPLNIARLLIMLVTMSSKQNVLLAMYKKRYV